MPFFDGLSGVGIVPAFQKRSKCLNTERSMKRTFCFASRGGGGSIVVEGKGEYLNIL